MTGESRRVHPAGSAVGLLQGLRWSSGDDLRVINDAAVSSRTNGDRSFTDQWIGRLHTVSRHVTTVSIVGVLNSWRILQSGTHRQMNLEIPTVLMALNLHFTYLLTHVVLPLLVKFGKRHWAASKNWTAHLQLTVCNIGSVIEVFYKKAQVLANIIRNHNQVLKTLYCSPHYTLCFVAYSHFLMNFCCGDNNTAYKPFSLGMTMFSLWWRWGW